MECHWALAWMEFWAAYQSILVFKEVKWSVKRNNSETEQVNRNGEQTMNDTLYLQYSSFILS